MEIIMDILAEASKEVNKTRIVYRANLNFNIGQKYLSLLVDKELLVKVVGDGGELYKTTERGTEVLNNYKRIKRFV